MYNPFRVLNAQAERILYVAKVKELLVKRKQIQLSYLYWKLVLMVSFSQH